MGKMEKKRPEKLIAYQFDSGKYSFLSGLEEYEAFMNKRDNLFDFLKGKKADRLSSTKILEYTDSYGQLLFNRQYQAE